MLTLAHPLALALVLLPLALRYVLPARRESRTAIAIPALGRLAELAGAQPGSGAIVPVPTALQRALVWTTWIGLVLATARPQWVGQPIEKTVPKRDLLLAVDLSGSMSTEDFTNAAGERVDRLTAVREVLDEFLEQREGDRVGLVVFGSAAFVQVPFTDDLDVCRALLAETSVGMAGPRTVLGDAIGLAIDVFERSELEDRVLIALTDGNDTGSRVPPDRAAEIAADRDITIHTVAVGDPAAVGEEQLDEETLRAMATATGGGYFHAADRDELAGIYRRLDEIEPREGQVLTHRPTSDLYHWVLGAVMVAGLGFHLIRTVRIGGGVRGTTAAAHAAALAAAAPAAPAMIGDFHFLRPLWLLSILPWLWIAWRARAGQAAARRLESVIAPHLLRHLVVGRDARRRFGPHQLLVAFGVVAAVALAGPAWRLEPSPFAEDAAALMVVLEVSPSMEERDVQPSRLARAAQKVGDLLARRPGARAGLVAYSGSAHLVLPPTRDAEILATFAAELAPHVMPLAGDEPAEALALADRQLTEAGLAGSIVWMADGAPPDAAAALGALAADGLAPVHALAIGGAPDERAGLESALGGTRTQVTVDDADVERLAGRVETSFRAAPAEADQRWRDEGWWLVPLLLLFGLFWYGRAGR